MKTAAYGIAAFDRADREDEAVASHPYAQRKGFRHAFGAGRATLSGRLIGRNADCIVIPVRDLETEDVVAIQAINAEGIKQSFGPISGHGLPLGNTLDPSLTRYVLEGWASAAALLAHYRGHACAFVAFGGSNLQNIADRVSELYGGRVVIGGEQDAA